MFLGRRDISNAAGNLTTITLAQAILCYLTPARELVGK